MTITKLREFGSGQTQEEITPLLLSTRMVNVYGLATTQNTDLKQTMEDTLMAMAIITSLSIMEMNLKTGLYLGWIKTTL